MQSETEKPGIPDRLRHEAHDAVAIRRLVDLLREEVERQKRDVAQEGDFANSRGWAYLPDKDRYEWRAACERAITFALESRPKPGAIAVGPSRPRFPFLRRVLRLLFGRPEQTP